MSESVQNNVKTHIADNSDHGKGLGNQTSYWNALDLPWVS